MEDKPDYVSTVFINLDPEFAKSTIKWLVECILRQHPQLPKADAELLKGGIFTRDEYHFLFLACLCCVKEVKDKAYELCPPERIRPFLMHLPTEFNVLIFGRHSWCKDVDAAHPLKYSSISQFVRCLQVDYINRYDPHGRFTQYYAPSLEPPVPSGNPPPSHM